MNITKAALVVGGLLAASPAMAQTRTTTPLGNNGWSITNGPGGSYTTYPLGNSTITQGPSGTYTTTPLGNSWMTTRTPPPSYAPSLPNPWTHH
jgi:hypothetical protein